MHPTRPRPQTRRAGPALLLALVAASLAGAQTATAEMLGHGPVLVVGYSPDEDAAGVARDLVLASAGWRWRWDGADMIDDALARVRVDFSWAVEPLVGGVFGDSEAFEASVVPYARFAPLGWENLVPYFEGGIGLAYTGLRNYGLGSRAQFSDNAGLGVTFGSGEGRRWSVGYRFRHLSHLGLFGDRNEGLNAHFLTVSVE